MQTSIYIYVYALHTYPASRAKLKICPTSFHRARSLASAHHQTTIFKHVLADTVEAISRGRGCCSLRVPRTVSLTLIGSHAASLSICIGAYLYTAAACVYVYIYIWAARPTLRELYLPRRYVIFEETLIQRKWHYCTLPIFQIIRRVYLYVFVRSFCFVNLRLSLSLSQSRRTMPVAWIKLNVHNGPCVYYGSLKYLFKGIFAISGQ